jgi:hypothetical protein
MLLRRYHDDPPGEELNAEPEETAEAQTAPEPAEKPTARKRTASK